MNKETYLGQTVEDRIAEDVGMCHAVRGEINAITILCDLLYFTNLHTKWKEDVRSAIEGVYPKYFKEHDLLQ